MLKYRTINCSVLNLKEDEKLTKLLEFDNENIFYKNAEFAGEILRNGGLVAIPTETVYGLGANAFDREAVKNIFKAKGRPNDNPLIVHVADVGMVENIVDEIPPKAKVLMDAFWPGPLSIIMKKRDVIPSEVSAGLSTVAVRMPEHKVALEIIKASGVCVAAPSANTSGRPSPTEAKHVLADLGDKIDAIADGGRCRVGIESTVIDMTQEIPAILRPGGITANMIREVIGEIKAPEIRLKDDDTPKCPGMKYEHYSPEAEVYVIECSKNIRKTAVEEVVNIYGKGKIGILDCSVFNTDTFCHEYIDCGDTSQKYACELFAALREFDIRKCDTVFALIYFDDQLSDSVRNRLYKAAGNKIIKTDEEK